MQPGGATALMYACQQCRENEVFEIMRKQPCSVKDRDRTLKTSLHYCAENPNTSCAEALLKEAPDLVNAQDENGYSSLHLAVIAGNKPLIKLLLAKGADVNVQDNEGHSAVHWAIVSSEKEALEMIIRAGANPSTPDIHGGYPLHYAVQMCGSNAERVTCFEDAVRVVETLLNFGVDVNVKDKDGRQPILWAASAGSADAVIHLVSGGACVEAADKDELTALHCAASRGHTATLETLISLCGANVDVIDGNGCSALFYSVTLGHADATELLLRLGAEPNRQDRKGRTPAHCGAAKGQLETLRILQKHGGNLWMRNVKGDIPLHEAVASGRKDLVLWLLSQNPEAINIANNDGRCSLHIASMYNNTEMVKVLLDSKSLVNPVMRTSKGVLMTPLNVALCKGHRSCGKYLQLHGGVPFSKVLKTEIASAVRMSPTNNTIVENSEISKEISSQNKISKSLAENQRNQGILTTESADKKKVYRRRKKKKSPSANTKDSDSEDSPHEVKLKTPERRKSDEGEENTKSKKVQLSKKSSKSLKDEELVVKTGKSKPLLKNKSFNETKNVSDLTPEDFPPLMQTVDQLDAVMMKPEANEVADEESEQKEEKGDGQVKNAGIKLIKEQTVSEKANEDNKEKMMREEKHVEENVEAIKPKKDVEEETDKSEEKKIKENEEKEISKSVEKKIKEGEAKEVDQSEIKKIEKDEEKVIDKSKVKNIEKDQQKEIGKSEEKKIKNNVKEESLKQDEEIITSKKNEIKKDVEEDTSKEELKVVIEEDFVKKEVKIEKAIKSVDEDFVNKNKTEKVKTRTTKNGLEEEITKKKVKTAVEEKIVRNGAEGTKIKEPVKVVVEDSKKNEVEKTEKDEEEKTVKSEAKKTEEDISEKEGGGETVKNLEVETGSEILMKSEKNGSDYVKNTTEEAKTQKIKEVYENREVKKAEELTLEKVDVSQHQPEQIMEKTKEPEEKVETQKEENSPSETDVKAEGVPLTEEKKIEKSIKSDPEGTPPATPGSNLQDENFRTSEAPGANVSKEQVEVKRETVTVSKESNSRGFEIPVKTDLEVEEFSKSYLSGTENNLEEENTMTEDMINEKNYEESEPSFDTQQKKGNEGSHFKAPRVSRLCRRHRDIKDDLSQVSVTQLVQNTIRKYHMERGIFYQLLELKRYQIRSGKANEQVLVKRLADEYERSRVFLGMKPFSGLYKFREFEKFLYDQLKALNTRRSFVIPEVKSYDDIDALSGFLKKSRYKIISEIPQPELSCTCITQRCHHSACAYTNVPCSGYITDLRHHRHHKPKRESFFPRIEPPPSAKSETLADRPATLELIQGSEKHVITLPQSSPAGGKRYYVTFTIKGAPGLKDEGYVNSSKYYTKHRHAKSV